MNLKTSDWESKVGKEIRTEVLELSFYKNTFSTHYYTMVGNSILGTIFWSHASMAFSKLIGMKKVI